MQLNCPTTDNEQLSTGAFKLLPSIAEFVAGEIEQQEAGEGAVSIHDLVKVNEPGISQRLWYDGYGFDAVQRAKFLWR